MPRELFEERACQHTDAQAQSGRVHMCNVLVYAYTYIREAMSFGGEWCVLHQFRFKWSNTPNVDAAFLTRPKGGVPHKSCVRFVVGPGCSECM